MQKLHLPLSEINDMSGKRVHEYVIILEEIGKMKKEAEERRNA